MLKRCLSRLAKANAGWTSGFFIICNIYTTFFYLRNKAPEGACDVLTHASETINTGAIRSRMCEGFADNMSAIRSRMCEGFAESLDRS